MGKFPKNIQFVDRTFINFKDQTYRWIDIKRFQYKCDPVDSKILLSILIADRHYRDSYDLENSHIEDSKTIHGPYLLSRISVASFDRADIEGVKTSLNKFCEYAGVLPAKEVTRRIKRDVFDQVRRATGVYRLRRLQNAKHDRGWVLDEFREFVIIDGVQKELLLVVGAID